MGRATESTGFGRALVVAAVGLVVVAAAAPAEACRRCGPHRGGYHLEVVVDGVALPPIQHEGRQYVVAPVGRRYTIRVRNDTSRRVEVVVSVDGRDVIDGEVADYRTKRGYLLGPYASYEIEGYRRSYSEVAAFRFSTVGDSYAARRGSPGNVGLIGAAFFPERHRARRSGALRPPPRTRFDDLGDGAGAPAAEEHTRMRRGRPQHAGTAYGERRYSAVEEVPFERAHPNRPETVVAVYYDDCDGLVAKGVRLGCTYPTCGPPCFRDPPRPFAPEPYGWEYR